MSLDKQTLDELSQDAATRRAARDRADAIKLYRLDLLAVRAEAEAKGRALGLLSARAEARQKARAEGEVRLLLKLLARRFGPVPEHVRARVEAATSEQVKAWAERLFTAASLDETLAP